MDKYEKREKRNLFAVALFILIALFLSGVVGDGQQWASTTEVAQWFLSFWGL